MYVCLSLHRDIHNYIYVGPGVRAVGKRGCIQSVITFEVLDRFGRSWARWKEKRIVFTFVTVPYFSAWGHGPGQGRNQSQTPEGAWSAPKLCSLAPCANFCVKMH